MPRSFVSRRECDHCVRAVYAAVHCGSVVFTQQCIVGPLCPCCLRSSALWVSDSIHKKYRNTSLISIYRIVSPADVSNFLIYWYQCLVLSSYGIFMCGVKKV